MMIYKYPLDFPDGDPEIEMPLNAEILACQIQAGKITLWAMHSVPPHYGAHTMVPRRIRIFHTGRPFTDPFNQLRHLGTVQLDRIVYHVFEEVPKS